MRDSIFHNYEEGKYPPWIKSVGGLLDISDFHVKSIPSLVGNSEIEQEFFCAVDFYCNEQQHSTTVVVECTEDLFQSCIDLFKGKADYQSSSVSIYKPKMKCLQIPDNFTIGSPDNIKCPRMNNGMISIGHWSKKHFKSKDDLDPETISEQVKKAQKAGNRIQLVVSVCAGTSATELNSDQLCLCLDTDRRALQAAVINMGGFGKSNVILAHFDMSKRLLQLLQLIKQKTEMDIVVLLQHPNPSKDDTSRNDIAKAGFDCVCALQTRIISSVHLVFDYHPTKTCWTRDSLQQAFIPPSQEVTGVFVSALKVIACENSSRVAHPLFGDTPRLGWSKLKTGSEHCFFISLPIK
jgi:hypothetical protein